jgi:glyoxylase-like metal-dependent hydrolase (beta-lactamase superfamily II)
MALRELRHNPCCMRPLTAVILMVALLFWMMVAVLKFPTLILGVVLSPILTRFQWLIEFWYPTGIGKQLHLWMIRLSLRSHPRDTTDANRGFHSRCTETRIEMIPQRVFIHPLPQFMDNLGYLVVCVPPPVASETPASVLTKETTSSGNVLFVDPHSNETTSAAAATTTHTGTKIVAFVVDCGDATAVVQHLQLIRETFYQNAPIHVQSILSTHKHHDHTAGNLDLVHTFKNSTGDDEASMAKYGGPIKLVFGGAADKVPGCNYPLANGDKLPLPKAGRNDMSDVIEVEAIATPAHTRGSMAYIVRPLLGNTTHHETDVCIFTGDTIFSAGGGVPFEADIDTTQEESAPKMTANSYIHASAAVYAMERCFAEVLYRTVPIPAGIATSPSSAMVAMTPTNITASTRDRVVILPGHEYSQELLTRQLSSPSTSPLSPCKWKHFEPAYFFHTVSQYYVSIIRRTSLPASSSGKILLIPTTLTRELYINPHLRSLRQRGTTVITALKLWNRHFAKNKIVQDNVEHGPAFGHENSTTNDTSIQMTKTRAQESQWNLNSVDLNRTVFTTVYTSDLETIIEELSAGQIDAGSAVAKLNELKVALQKPVVSRRPIPGTLPTSRAVYRGLLGFTLLASAPTALTRSDSQSMKLPEPIVNTSSSDHICISKRRLITVLFCLGLLDADDGKFIVAIIQQLWKEVKEVTTNDWKPQHSNKNSTKVSESDGEAVLEQNKEEIENTSTDAESVSEAANDECELGALKWVIYGIPAQQRPKSWLNKYCMPCAKKDEDDGPTNKIHTSTHMKRHGGELVRHDVFTCPLCRDATGCTTQQLHSHQIEENDGYVHQITTVGTNAEHRQIEDRDDNDDESTTFIEVYQPIQLHP